MTLTDDEVDADRPVQDVDGSARARDKPVTHTSVHRPLCAECRKLRQYFDLKCAGCRSILYKDTTTIAQVFAILRQWNPETQQNIEFYIREILRRGAHADDRDAATGMTLLHFAVKAGADGISDPRPASRAIKLLLSKGADVKARCLSTDMTAVHYAAFFNSPTLIDLLMTYNIDIDINDTSCVMEGASALHMSAMTMAYDAAQCLLKYGADPGLRDKRGRSPIQCIPSVVVGHADAALLRDKLHQLLSCQSLEDPPSPPVLDNHNQVHDGLSLGDHVLVGGIKRGHLRFVGAAQFAPGIWAGVELVDPIGKNNGTLNGVQYFSCQHNHGIFAPLSKITKVRPRPAKKRPNSAFTVVGRSRNFTAVGSKIDTGRRGSTADQFSVGEEVEVAGGRTGVIKYIGDTHFASGVWYGIELSNAAGKNDGSIADVRYFTCPRDKGIFAPPSRIRKIRSYKPEQSNLLPQKSLSKSRSRLVQSAAPASRARNERLKASKSVMDLTNTRRSLAQTKSKSVSSTNLLSKSMSLPADTGHLKLEKGLTVLCNNELAVIRYLGPVEFADGLWVGVEFRKPCGRNDGTVEGKRYFSCRDNHGVMVRPSKVSVRGIRGDRLTEGNTYVGEEIMV